MYFGYPIAAVAENWLHECMVEVVTTIHVRLNARQRALAWPLIIPEACRARLNSRTGLRNYLTTYTKAARKLDPAQRAQVLNCLQQQNAIADLVSCASNCDGLSDLPAEIRAPAKDLFVFAFGLLTDLGVRDRHYAIIHEACKHQVCPFCCSEYFDAPGAPREDYDHYLAVSRYPFAAANLRNLTPMGMKCNERYKRDQDVLRDEAGNRRLSFDPYANRQLGVSLMNSIPFGQDDEKTPVWHIDFVPESPECATWDSVFQIRTRLSRDILDQSFSHWLTVFAGWFVRRKGTGDTSDAHLIAAVREHAEDIELAGMKAREFLCGPVFRMIELRCTNGDNRLLQFIRDLITQAVPQPVSLV